MPLTRLLMEITLTMTLLALARAVHSTTAVSPAKRRRSASKVLQARARFNVLSSPCLK